MYGSIERVDSARKQKRNAIEEEIDCSNRIKRQKRQHNTTRI